MTGLIGRMSSVNVYKFPSLRILVVGWNVRLVVVAVASESLTSVMASSSVPRVEANLDYPPSDTLVLRPYGTGLSLPRFWWYW